jgi:Family of unknown function (DUF6186)
MTSRDVTVLGYMAVLAAGVLVGLLARRTRLRIPALADVLAHIMRTRTGRVGMLVAWAWVGLHFFSR